MFGIACMEELTRGAVAGSQRPRKTCECQAFGTTTCPDHDDDYASSRREWNMHVYLERWK